MRFNNEIIDLIERETFVSYDEYGDYLTLYVDNDCQEDFQIEIRRNNKEIEEVINYCDDFDPDEHFDLWWGQNKGEPKIPSVLFRNCLDIGETLTKLANILREVIKNEQE